jgi:hypothetical protein
MKDLKFLKASESKNFNKSIVETIKTTALREPPSELTQTILVEFGEESSPVIVKLLPANNYRPATKDH